MESMPKSRFARYNQGRLREHFGMGSTIQSAAQLCDVNRKTAAFFFLCLRDNILRIEK